MFGSPKGSRNFNLGDHLLGLGTQAKTPGSPRGFLKFFLEHSLGNLTAIFELTNQCSWNETSSKEKIGLPPMGIAAQF